MRSLEFGDKSFEPSIRMLYEMKEVIYDREWLKDAENSELYYMYRDLALSDGDRKAIESNGLRYDITVIPAGTKATPVIHSTKRATTKTLSRPAKNC